MIYIRAAVSGKWGNNCEWHVSNRMQWFYRLKAVICLLLNREPRKGKHVYDHVHVTYTDSGTSWSEDGTAHWFEALVVGYGIFRNWWAVVYQDSD